MKGEKEMKKKILSFSLSLMMILSMIIPVSATNDAVSCYVRIATSDMIVQPRVQLEVNKDAADTVFGTNYNSNPTIMDALVEVVYYSLFQSDGNIENFENERDSIKECIDLNGTWLKGIFGTNNEGNNYWGYTDGTQTTGVMDETYLSNDSDICFYYSDYTNTYGGYFDKIVYNIQTNQDLTVDIFGIDRTKYNSYQEEYLNNANVTISNDEGVEVASQTSKDGKVTFSNLTVGTYTMTASWNEGNHCFIAPEATVNVTKEKPSNAGIDTKKPEYSKSDIDFLDAYSAMNKKINNESLINSANDDINVFWNMLAKGAMNGKVSSIDIDFNNLDYATLVKTPQKLAKVLIAMANNNYSINNRVYNNKTIVELLLDSMENDGSFSSLNRKNQKIKAYANEQVWCLIALEIVDANYDKEKALNYLYSCQNSDNGFGYGQYSDCGISSWVISLSEIMNIDENVTNKTVDYINSQWDDLYQINDSSSMAPFLSTHYATDKQMKQFLSASYNNQGEYFTWGSTSTSENAYAKYPSIQCLGDYKNKTSVYEMLDAYYDGTQKPKLVSGDNQSFNIKEGKTLTFKSDANISDFEKVLIDNKEVDSSNYELKEGSTIITLNKDYLKQLSSGKHSIQIISTTGIVATTFEVKDNENKPVEDNKNKPNGNVEDNSNNTNATTNEVISTTNKKKENTKSVKTGDTNNNVYLILLFASMMGCVYIAKQKNEID